MSLEFRNIENLVSKFTQQIHISVAVPTVQLKYLNINTSNVIFDILVFTSTSDFQKFRDFGGEILECYFK
jgi:uroporphyrinogen-III synthase